MIFADLLAGDTVFLDANTLVYHFAHDKVFGPTCSQLLDRIQRQEISGFTSTHVLTELAHRIMTIEAIAAFGWPITGIAQRLRRHPSHVQQLSGFRKAVEMVLQSQVQVLTIPPALIAAAVVVSQQTSLLSNDALIVAVMQANSLSKLASSDGDFDRVPGLTRYGPI